MKKIVFGLLFMVAIALAAKVDYSSMSTEELLAMMGYIPAKNINSFRQELNNRLQTMSPKEKKIYKKNLRKMKK